MELMPVLLQWDVAKDRWWLGWPYHNTFANTHLVLSFLNSSPAPAQYWLFHFRPQIVTLLTCFLGAHPDSHSDIGRHICSYDVNRMLLWPVRLSRVSVSPGFLIQSAGEIERQLKVLMSDENFTAANGWYRDTCTYQQVLSACST